MSTFAELFSAGAGAGESGEFLVRWRGREEGPYPAELIEKKLSANEIGVLHEILHDGKWVTIRQYLADREATLRANRQVQEERQRHDRDEQERLEREAEERNEWLREERLRAAAPPPVVSQNEAVFIDEGGVLVTKTRFVAGSRTFALTGITSVRGVQIDPNRLGPLLMPILGILACVLGGAWMSDLKTVVKNIVIAITIISSLVAGIVWWLRQKPEFAVVLTTSGGEITAYRSSDPSFY